VSASFLKGTIIILSSMSSAILVHLFSIMDHFWSLLRLQLCLLGCDVNLLAVLCITQAGTLRLLFVAFISLFFIPKGFRLDMVITSL
jgi:uncharacterized metal-binding protein